MYIISVIPYTKKTIFDSLSYFSPENLQKGTIVEIEIRKSKTKALVTDSTDVREYKGEIKDAPFEIKKINQVLGTIGCDTDYLKALEQITKRYRTSLRKIYELCIPEIFFRVDAFLNKINENNSLETKTNAQNEKLIFQAPLSDRLHEYKTLIRESFAKGQSVHVILPTTDGVDFFFEKLSRGVEKYSYYFHSNKTKKSLDTDSVLVLKEPHPVLIVSTTSYISIPRNDRSTIILEKEHSRAYKSIPSPHIDMRDVVLFFCALSKAKLILADTLLRVETLVLEERGFYNKRSQSIFRIDSDIPVEIVNRDMDESVGTFDLIPKETLQTLTEKPALLSHTFLFTLRSGLATMIRCRDCSLNITCTSCDAPLGLYRDVTKQIRVLICNKCKRHTPTNVLCPRCGSWNLGLFGISSDKTYEYIKEKLPDRSVFLIDKESTQNETSCKKVAKEFGETKGSILIGTEKAIQFLEKPVEQTIVVSLDTLWSIPNFSTGENIIHILFEMLRVTEKKLTVITSVKEMSPLLAFQTKNLMNWFKEESAERKILGYPPFTTILKYVILGREEYIERLRGIFEEKLKKYTADIFSTTSKKERGFLELHLVVRVPRIEPFFIEDTGTIDTVIGIFEECAEGGILFINPENILR